MFVPSSSGGTIHMVCRNKDKAEEARADIVKETGNKVHVTHFKNKTLTLLFKMSAVITGSLRPHPGPV